ncbi:type II toxin-antitoxin system HipA family toxin [Mesorhizobium sp. L-8-3]|uniref:type II toxin-antitoxin system HipA family toxin n=1 Tax=Mesorhizobium sp. L-8-3 TaxID=2744522 RepID=UPI001925333B|nr:HipA domain-containing protein [Mesorhizobium sp. L-8-3]BCH27787.1 putative kinase Y4dM [Mesorhizobium sp. L-8-3]
MPDVSVLDVALYGSKIGTLTLLQGDRSIFAFTQDYIDDDGRPTLSLSFKDDHGALITELPATQTRVLPFFSNLLPEGPLRKYLAERAGVKEVREFFLLWVLGRDLPGAVTITPTNGDAWPPTSDAAGGSEREQKEKALRFSLAGVQLKFSAVRKKGKNSGLVIPAKGVGGSWIVKLPAERFDGVPENEFSMMTIASRIGINVPEIDLVDVDSLEGLPEGLGRLRGDKAFAIRRFDRNGEALVHIEDFAQVFRRYPDEKYETASYRNIATVLGIETNEDSIAEFIRRLVFCTLIGNADMHLKNWSLIYYDRRSPALSPAHDLVSTIPYIPDETAALKFARTNKVSEFNEDELRYLAAKARLPEKLVLDTAHDTVTRFLETWQAEKKNLWLAPDVIDAIDRNVAIVPLVKEGIG